MENIKAKQDRINDIVTELEQLTDSKAMMVVMLARLERREEKLKDELRFHTTNLAIEINGTIKTKVGLETIKLKIRGITP